jgi:hypothetical protein
MKIINLIIVVALSSFFWACKDDNQIGKEPEQKQTQIKLIAKGPSVAQAKIKTNPDTGEPVQAFCFLMDLVDPATGEVIGILEDCDLETIEFPDGTLLSKVLTKFNLTGKGTITSWGEVLQTPIGDGKFTTELTTAENNIIDATFDFEGSEGKVTLKGEIDLTQFDQNIVIFNCNWNIDLESYEKAD